MNIAATGVVLAVGGPAGLLALDKNNVPIQYPPPLPPFYSWFGFNITLQSGPPGWNSYQLCNMSQPAVFPPQNQSADPNAPAPSWGFDPRQLLPNGQPVSQKNPCKNLLTDHYKLPNGTEQPRTYEFDIVQATIPFPPFSGPSNVPPNPIWTPTPPNFPFNGTAVVNPVPPSANVVACPTVPNFVPPSGFCNHTNAIIMLANPPTTSGQNSLLARSPAPIF
jgi:hypothetical protein